MNSATIDAGTDQRSESMGSALLQGRGLTKSYGPIRVLHNIDVTVRGGEVLAICGENGAGKSTLMKILSGVIPAGSFEGSIEFKGEPQSFLPCGREPRGDRPGAPGAARRRPSVDRGEHVREQPAGTLRALRRADGGEMGERGARRVRPERDPIASPQLVAHAFRATPDRAGGGASPLAASLILDEPTAALTDVEADALIEQLRRIRDSGWASSISRIALTNSTGSPTALVLRNGAVVESYDSVPTRSELVRAMLGDTLQSIQALAEEAPFVHTGEPVLQIEDFSVYADLAQRRPRASNVSLQVYPGEIVGSTGWSGLGEPSLPGLYSACGPAR